MQTDCNSDHLAFESFDGRRIVAAFDGGAITSNAGALLLRHTDKAIDLFDRVAACFSDQRDRSQVVHGLPALVGQRIAGIALGYEDVEDHDELRRSSRSVENLHLLDQRHAWHTKGGRWGFSPSPFLEGLPVAA